MKNKHQMIEETSRLTADEIFDAAYDSGRDELARSTKALVFSGFIAGLTVGLSPLASAMVASLMGSDAGACPASRATTAV